MQRVMPTDEPRLAGLINSGKADKLQRALDHRLDIGLDLRPGGDNPIHHRDAVGAHDRLEDRLIHAEGRAEHTRANIGQVGQLEQALQRAVLAEGAVQHREDNIQLGQGLEISDEPGWTE